MKEIDEIKELLSSISATFERMAENEKQFDLDTCIHFEHLSQDTYRMANDLKLIRQSYGV